MEISGELISKKIEDAVKNFNFVEEFLGIHKERLIRNYQLFYSQIKNNERLEIKIDKSVREGKFGQIFYTPIFQIVLYKQNSLGKVVYSMNSNGEVLRGIDGKLEYITHTSKHQQHLY